MKEPSSQERREREEEREKEKRGRGAEPRQPVKKEKNEGQSEFWANQKNFGIGQPRIFFIYGQVEPHLGSPQGEMDLATGLADVQLPTWECRLCNVDLTIGHMDFAIWQTGLGKLVK